MAEDKDKKENTNQSKPKDPNKKFTVLTAFKTDKKEYQKGDTFSHSNEKVIVHLKQKKHI